MAESSYVIRRGVCRTVTKLSHKSLPSDLSFVVMEEDAEGSQDSNADRSYDERRLGEVWKSRAGGEGEGAAGRANTMLQQIDGEKCG